MNILDKIIATKRTELEALRSFKSFESIAKEARAEERTVVSFSGALASSQTGIIAEFKRRSPSKGFIKEGALIDNIVPGYEKNGAAAISILTDHDYFGGSLDDLQQARNLCSVPLLRKDFIIDPYQICQARLAGADVILLIAAALSPEQVSELARFARVLSMEVLLEIHNEAELAHVCPDVNVVGVNNRDLTTFVTDIEVSRRLADRIPDSFIKISESGISDPATVISLRECGYRGFLMGENFMKTDDPASSLRDFINRLK